MRRQRGCPGRLAAGRTGLCDRHTSTRHPSFQTRSGKSGSGVARHPGHSRAGAPRCAAASADSRRQQGRGEEVHGAGTVRRTRSRDGRRAGRSNTSTPGQPAQPAGRNRTSRSVHRRPARRPGPHAASTGPPRTHPDRHTSRRPPYPTHTGTNTESNRQIVFRNRSSRGKQTDIGDESPPAAAAGDTHHRRSASDDSPSRNSSRHHHATPAIRGRPAGPDPRAAATTTFRPGPQSATQPRTGHHPPQKAPPEPARQQPSPLHSPGDRTSAITQSNSPDPTEPTTSPPGPSHPPQKINPVRPGPHPPPKTPPDQPAHPPPAATQHPARHNPPEQPPHTRTATPNPLPPHSADNEHYVK